VADGTSPRAGAEVVEPTQAETAHARRVAEAKATVPHVYFEAEAAAQAAPAAELVLAAAGALREFPRINASYRDAAFELHSRINIGIAVTAGGSLVYPTIQDADQKAVDEIANEIAQLAERARGGVITQPELSGATFSVADLGPLGISRADLVVNRGQAAILAAGTRDGGTTSLSLACDNRIVQAPDAAGFLGRVKVLLEETQT
jgi:pyruvate dehydrogenase E2 component (dihydrolipoamide acetyltransferase)